MGNQVETPVGGHPLAEFTTRLRTRLDQLTATSARPVRATVAAEQRHVLTELAVASAQLESLR